MEKERVSIIIPNFNRANFIGETLYSVISQTYQNWEAIVVDDGSTDGSLDIIESYAKKDGRISSFIRDRLPKGPSTCRNIGVEKSKGEYLIFLDSDDLLAPFCLAQRVEFMMKNSNLDFGVFNLELFKYTPGDTSIVFNKYGNNKDCYLKMFMRNELPWACPNPIWRKDSFNRLGGFDENLIIMEDPELHTRALIDDFNFKVVKDTSPDCFYRQNSFNEEKKEYFYDLSIKGRIYFIRKTITLLKNKELDKIEYKSYLKNLRIAYIKLIKQFFIARVSSNVDLYFNTLKWCKREKIISGIDNILLTLLAKSWLSNNVLIKRFRIKGILTQFIR